MRPPPFIQSYERKERGSVFRWPDVSSLLTWPKLLKLTIVLKVFTQICCKSLPPLRSVNSSKAWSQMRKWVLIAFILTYATKVSEAGVQDVWGLFKKVLPRLSLELKHERSLFWWKFNFRSVDRSCTSIPDFTVAVATSALFFEQQQ